MATAVLPLSLRRWLRGQQIRYRLQNPRVGTIEWGDFRRIAPISPVFALDRGQAVDRYYIERFLKGNARDIRGRVLEMGDNYYTVKFGESRVSKSDVMHLVAGNPEATIIGDLTAADHIPTESFDCIILTQTLQMIYDQRAALTHLYRILKPGGVLLVTGPGIARISRREGVDPWGEYWHYTSQAAARLFAEFFPAPNVHLTVFGNVLAALGMMHGLAIQELGTSALDTLDPDYEVLVCVRAVKPLGP